MAGESPKAVVEVPPSPATGYWPSGPPTWGDLLVVCSLVIGAITWAVSQKKDRDEEKRARSLRQEDLTWRRTEFLFEQAKLFDTDADIASIVQIIADNVPDVRIETVLDDSKPLDPARRGRYRHGLDKLLNLMERLAFAVKCGAITPEELRTLEWYYNAMQADPCLKDYCLRFFPEVLVMARELVPEPRAKATRLAL